MGRVVAELRDERLDVRDLLRLSPEPVHDSFQLPGAHLFVVGVVAVEHRHSGHVDLRHGLHHDVEKIAVVGDEEEAAGEIGEELLQPRARFDVEVVRRLVEEQDIRGLQQCN